MNEEFDAWFTAELDRGLGRAHPPERAALPARARGITLKAGLVAMAAVVVTGGVALAAGTATTGSPNPAVWGQQVQAHVQTCRQQLASGQHGIGDCVSSFAKQHGQEQRAAHAQGAASHGAAAGHGHGRGASPAHSPDAKESPAS